MNPSPISTDLGTLPTEVGESAAQYVLDLTQDVFNLSDIPACMCRRVSVETHDIDWWWVVRSYLKGYLWGERHAATNEISIRLKRAAFDNVYMEENFPPSTTLDWWEAVEGALKESNRGSTGPFTGRINAFVSGALFVRASE